MSLDDADAQISRIIAGATKGRMDFMRAVQEFHLALIVALRFVEQDQGMGGLQNHFTSALELAVSELEGRLSSDEKDQFRRLYQYFQEMLKDASSAPPC